MTAQPADPINSFRLPIAIQCASIEAEIDALWSHEDDVVYFESARIGQHVIGPDAMARALIDDPRRPHEGAAELERQRLIAQTYFNETLRPDLVRAEKDDRHDG